VTGWRRNRFALAQRHRYAMDGGLPIARLGAVDLREQDFDGLAPQLVVRERDGREPGPAPIR
jgi:hypothetical protein